MYTYTYIYTYSIDIITYYIDDSLQYSTFTPLMSLQNTRFEGHHLSYDENNIIGASTPDAWRTLYLYILLLRGWGR